MTRTKSVSLSMLFLESFVGDVGKLLVTEVDKLLHDLPNADMVRIEVIELDKGGTGDMPRVGP